LWTPTGARGTRGAGRSVPTCSTWTTRAFVKVTDVPFELEASVGEAVANCPERAITATPA
jgi:ferredoxin